MNLMKIVIFCRYFVVYNVRYIGFGKLKLVIVKNKIAVFYRVKYST